MTAFTTRPEILGTFGVVTSTHWIGSAVGMSFLERGGNAFDAAVATGFALQIVEPHLNGPAGDFTALFHRADGAGPEVLCAQGPMPAAATLEHFRGLGLDTIPGSGLLPAVIPGSFDGWMLLLRDHGTLTLRDVLEPAIGYAERGYPVVPKMTDTIGKVARLFNDEWTTSGALWLENGKPPAPGSVHTNRTLAATYRRIIEEAEARSSDREGQIDAARDIWQRGWVAETIDRFARTQSVLDPSGEKHGGLLTAEDMADWQATYEQPATLEYGNHTVCKCGFWNQGPVMLQQLAMLEDMGLADMPADGPDFVHAVTEAAKLAFADREAWYGDPAFVDVPGGTLLSKDYAATRRALVEHSASMDLRPGSPDGREPDISAALAATGDAGPLAEFMGVGEPTVQPTGATQGDTVHLDIIDRHGNMISVTPSGGWLQSSPAIPELGFCLGNRGQMVWLDETSPSVLVPGKRPRTTLSPSLALRDGEPFMVFGTPGGDQQDQWSTLLFLHHAEHGMNLQECIDAPAFHSEHFPSSFWPRGRKPGRLVLESRFPEATVEALRARGHDVSVGEPWSEGRLTAACRDGGLLKAAANPRGMQGYAAGR